MALLWFDGFDHYGLDETKLTEGPYDQVDAAFTLSEVNPRTGARCLRRDSSAVESRVIKSFSFERDIMAAGISAHLGTLPGTGPVYALLSFLDIDQVEQVTISITQDGRVQAMLGGIDGELIGSSDPTVLSAGEYVHVESAVKSDTGSVIESTITIIDENFETGLGQYAITGPDVFSTSSDEITIVGVAGGTDSNATREFNLGQHRLVAIRFDFVLNVINRNDAARIALNDQLGGNIFALFPMPDDIVSSNRFVGLITQLNEITTVSLSQSEKYSFSGEFTESGLVYSLVDSGGNVLASGTDTTSSAERTLGELRFNNDNDNVDPSGGGESATYSNVEIDIERDELIGPDGILEVRVNGVTVISKSSAKTINTDKKSYSGVSLKCGSDSSHGVTTDIDDFYIWDDQGSWNNSFLGDKRALLRPPNADTNVSDFEPSSGDFGYQMIDEDSPDEDATFILAESALLPGSPPSGSSEFEIQNLPNGVSHIAGVSIFTRAAKTDADDTEIFTSIISGVNSVSGSPHELAETYGYHVDLYEYDPATIANFTKDGFDLSLVSINVEFAVGEGSPGEGSPGEGSPGGDPFFDSVVTLLHFDGTDGSTDFTDVIGKTWTANGNAQIDTAQSKFGGASGLFDGTGDYLQSTETTEFNVGSQDFTIECWARPDVISGIKVLFARQAAGAMALQFRINANKLELLIRGSGGGTVFTAVSSNNLTTAGFQHLAGVRSGDDLMVFIDGNLEATTTGVDSVDLTDSTAPAIVAAFRNFPTAAASFYDGWLDDMRFTVGVARYTSNFTPPTAPFEDF